MPGRGRWAGAGLAAIAGAVGLAFAPVDRGWWSHEPSEEWAGSGTGVVEAVEIGGELVVGGLTCSRHQTLIDAEVEFIADEPPVFGTFGMAAPTRIIEVVPAGSVVAKGEVLCRLDASAYQERARRLRIEVDRARSEEAAARTGLVVAEAELTAYRDGERVRRERELQTAVALSTVERTRAGDTVAWTEHMGTLGYVAMADLADARLDRLRTEVQRRKAEGELDAFRRYTVSKQVRTFESNVARARNTLRFATEQLKGADERLKTAETQVDRCTIKAPHPGRVLYFDQFYEGEYIIREGAEIYPGLPLFVLPDLTEMEVELYVHERSSTRVAEGQEAAVTFAGFPGRSFPAHLREVNLLPEPDWRHFGESQQVRVRVALDEVPEGLLPEMTARVAIATGAPERRATVPAGAVRWDDDGESFCVVRTATGWERRPVAVDRGTVDRLIVRRGLDEGEVVLLLPERRDGDSRPGAAAR